MNEPAPPLLRRVERFLEAVREGRGPRASRLLARWPEIARTNLFVACCAGETVFLEALLAAYPQLVSVGHPGDGMTPLLYACASPLHEVDPEGDPTRAAGILRCAELLLDRGASPNEHTLFDPKDPTSKIPALYYACIGNHVALAALLLARGAEPNDGESIYHAAERNHRQCLELLRAHGAELSQPHARWGNTPLYFLCGWKEWHPMFATAREGMRWLLEQGADPDVPSYDQRETPLHRLAAWGHSRGTVEMFLERGAAVDPARADGRTPYVLALRAGNDAVADLLRERGADVSRPTAIDRFLAACLAGDEARAREILTLEPGLMSELTGEDLQTLAEAASQRREAAVPLMAALGFDLAHEGAWGGTPLHHAAWHGDVAMTRLLLSLGAPLDPRDREFGCSPIAWAAHGSTNCRHADDDYRAVVALLLDAGARREPSFNRWGEPPERLASRRVARLLEERGFAPPRGSRPLA